MSPIISYLEFFYKYINKYLFIIKNKSPKDYVFNIEKIFFLHPLNYFYISISVSCLFNIFIYMIYYFIIVHNKAYFYI